MSEAPNAASNPNLAGVMSVLQSRRQRWEAACDPLIERARFLSRHGVANDINDIARQACDVTHEGPESGVPGTDGAAAPAGGAAPAPAAP